MSIIPYLFDAFPPAGTLAALTAAASARLLFAGAIPLTILFDITTLTPKWAFSIYGFISIAMWPIPFLLFRYGSTWRSKSKYSKVPLIDGTPLHRKLASQDGEMISHDSAAKHA
jgi:DHA1 family multidrug resistance protein-like MFS transporter